MPTVKRKAGARGPGPGRRSPAPLDPILFEVIRNALVEVTEEMTVTLKRSAYSTNIKSRDDFSCSLFDAELRVVAQSFAQGTHLAALAHMVPIAVKELGVEAFGPGDQILMNDPHRGSVHLNEVALIAPIYWEGRIFGYVGNVAHHTDVGGKAPASLCVSTEIFQEGVIIPPVKVVENEKIVEPILKFFLANVRAPKQTAGDVRAQIASNITAIRRAHDLLRRYGRETLTRYMDELLHYTERRARAEFKKFPNGACEATTFLDGDGVGPDPIPLKVRLVIQDGDITLDLSDVPPQNRGSMNATYVSTFAALGYVLKSLIDEDIPVNNGFHRLLKIKAPKGCYLNAVYPAPVVGTAEICVRLCDLLYKALAQLMPERVVASTKGIIYNLGWGGTDPRDGEYYCFMETIAGGYGGRPGKDGPDAVQCHVQNSENCPIEEAEIDNPFRVIRYELIPDSEGAGRYRGGVGLRRDYLFPGHEVDYTVLTDRTLYPPWGLFGGGDAQPTRIILDPGGEAQAMPSKFTIRIPADGTISIQSPGGGGYGPATEREPAAVVEDVRDGKITPGRARDVYGVVIDTQRWVVDEAATAARRAELRMETVRE